MAKKAKAKEAPAVQEPEHDPAQAEEKAPEVVSYKLSPSEALSRLRDLDFALLSDDDRRSVILEIKGLLAELMAAQESLRHFLEERLWLLQTWDNVVQLRVTSVRQEQAIPPLSMNVSRYFDEKKLEDAALAEKARIEAEEAAEKAAQEAAAKKAEEEAKAKAAEAAQSAEHQEIHEDDQSHSSDHEVPEPHPAEATIEPEINEETKSEAPAAELITDAEDQEMLVSDSPAETTEPALALDPNEEGYVKLRLVEPTEFDNIRLPPHINIEIKQEHAEELVRKESARPLPADTPLTESSDKK